MIEKKDEEMANILRVLPKERPVTAAQEAALDAQVGAARPHRRWIRDLALAAGIAVAAFLAGRTTAVPASASAAEPRFMLLVHEDLPLATNPAILHDEYARWAGGLAQRGQLSGGDELGDTRMILSGATPLRRVSARADRTVGGYFLLTARTEADALTIARDCPHLKRGGTVELREIVRR